MNKAQLVEAIVKDTELTKVKAGLAVDSLMAAVTGALKSGDSVTLIGFGSFSVVKRAARVGRNPKTGKEIKIPAKIVPKFKAGKALKETIAGVKSAAKAKPVAKAVVKKVAKKK